MVTILEMGGVSKSFDGNRVLKNVDFSVEAGEIHALLGENGAGKSTLLNILAGVLPMDEGSILFDGEHYTHPSIGQMEKAGVAFVHQELNVVNDLTVSENIFFNHELAYPLGFLKRKEMVSQTRALFERLGVDIDPTRKVGELKTSQKQLLEICRALHADAKLLILDEPTTALGTRRDRAPVLDPAATEGRRQVLHLRLPQDAGGVRDRRHLHGAAQR